MLMLIDYGTTYSLREQKPQFAVLPVGSYEQHGYHLPMSTDTILACAIGRKIAEKNNGFCLPPITFSCSQEHQGFFGSTWISSHTLYAMLDDIASSLKYSGIKKIVLVNGHGGNYVTNNFAQEMNMDEASVLMLPTRTHRRQALETAGIETQPDDDMHGGEYETSLMLAIDEDSVKKELIQDHHVDNWDLLTLTGMKHYSQAGTIGSPSLATVEKGRLFLEAVSDNVAEDIDFFLHRRSSQKKTLQEQMMAYDAYKELITTGTHHTKKPFGAQLQHVFSDKARVTALDALVEEGLLRVEGSAYYLMERPAISKRSTSFQTDYESIGRVPRTERIELAKVARASVPQQVAEVFTATQHFIHYKTLQSVDGVPHAICDAYYSCDQHHNLYEILEELHVDTCDFFEEKGFSPDHKNESLKVDTPSFEERHLLDILDKKRINVVRIQGTISTAEGQPLETYFLCDRADLYEFSYEDIQL